MNTTALPVSKRDVPRGATSLAAFNLFLDAHTTSAPTMNKQAALSNYGAQVAYLNRSIAELEGTGSAPAKAPAKAATTKKAASAKKTITAKGKKAAGKSISA